MDKEQTREPPPAPTAGMDTVGPNVAEPEGPAEQSRPAAVDPTALVAGSASWMVGLRGFQVAVGTLAYESDGALVVGGAMETGGIVDGEMLVDADELQAFVARFNRDGELLNSLVWGGAGRDGVRDVVPLADGDLVVAGYRNAPRETGSRSTAEADVRRLSTDGEVRWDIAFGSEETGADTAEAVALGQDGTIYVAGRLAGVATAQGFDVGPETFVVALSPESGDVLWGVTLPKSLVDIATGEDGVFVLIHELVDTDAASNRPGDMIVVKLDFEGSEVWRYTTRGRLAEDERINPFGLAVEPNAVVAFAAPSQPGAVPFLASFGVHLSPEDGSLQHIDNLGINYLRFARVAQTPDGYRIIGQHLIADDWRTRLWALDSMFQPIGEASPVSGRPNGPFAIAASPEGALTLGGHIDSVRLGDPEASVSAAGNALRGSDVSWIVSLDAPQREMPANP